ncbi:unnamed protein product [Heterobilharzia americana]|nr:unnamed protein product [Heterobilharzia americana]
MMDKFPAQIQKGRLAFTHVCHQWPRYDTRLGFNGQVYYIAVRLVLLYGSEKRPLKVGDTKKFHSGVRPWLLSQHEPCDMMSPQQSETVVQCSQFFNVSQTDISL